MLKTILKSALGIWIALVIVAALLYAPPAMGLGDLSRIIYFHVPLAWVGVLAYLISMVYSVRFLRRGLIKDDSLAAVNAEIGFIFTLLATITGAVFARFTWGVFWNWDPRQTSIFILLLIYSAYFVLRSSVDEEGRRARLSSVFSIFAFISVPFLVFVIPRVYATLHPDPIISTESGFQMNAVMFRVFLASLVGFTGIYAWIFNLSSRLINLEQNNRRENE
jgi:heme exporter protein C